MRLFHKAPETQLDWYLENEQPVFVFFHSTTCQTCIDMMAVVDQVYPEFKGQVGLVDVDVYSKPAVLFFNRHKGCACASVVYRAAANQVRDWSEEDRQGVQLIQIDLDRRPDLGAQFNVIRAPSLLLLDRNGKIIYRQNEVVTDTEPLNLAMIESKIAEVLDGE